MEVWDLYYNLVIMPLEEARNDMKAKVKSKNLFDIIMKSTYKKYLEEYEALLLEKYHQLDDMIKEAIDN